MKILVFDTDPSVREIFDSELPNDEKVYFDTALHIDELSSHADAQALSVFVSSSVTRECLDALPQLKLIATRSTGIDHIDAAYAKEKGITISNVPKYGAHTVAEFAFALILSLSRRLPEAVAQVREEGRFATTEFEGFDLFGKTIGIVGTGAIGRGVVSIARGFGMHVLMYDPFPNESLISDDARYVPFEELLSQADIVTLHVPYTKENHHLLNREKMALMKQDAYVINTARGELVETEALLDALREKRLAGAGLDVLEEERVLKDEMELVKGIESIHELKTLIRDHALIDTPRVIITPHIAFFSREAYHEILSVSVSNIEHFEKGTPQNVVLL